MDVAYVELGKTLPCVLGLARGGLIFTRSQEGTQLGWMIQIGQTKQGI